MNRRSNEARFGEWEGVYVIALSAFVWLITEFLLTGPDFHLPDIGSKPQFCSPL